VTLALVLGGTVFGLALTGAALGAVMGLAGLVILEFFAGGATDLGILAVWNLTNNFNFSAIPMFMLLGDLLVAGGLSTRIYAAVAPLFERLPGRLLHSNIAVSTLFGAVSGSSAATSAAVGAVAYPELESRGYHAPTVAASIAAGGTLGLLIPPSLSLLIFGAWQDVSIGQLFLAGIVPGLMMAALFMLYIALDAWRRTANTGPAGPLRGAREIIRGLLGLWPLAILVASVLGTIYTGLATPTEAAGLGVLAATILGFSVGELTVKRVLGAAVASIASFGAIAFILMGAAILSQAVTLVGVSGKLMQFVTAFQLSKYELVAATVLFFLVMGIFFDGVTLMLTTVPFVFPVLTAAGFDPVWIGVFVTIMIEIGMLTPPVGVNLFIALAIAKGRVTLGQLSKECLPYWVMLLIGTALLTVFPQIALFLPRVVY
jgi:tripartite ATP-independent transporter DctM subunit